MRNETMRSHLPIHHADAVGKCPVVLTFKEQRHCQNTRDANSSKSPDNECSIGDPKDLGSPTSKRSDEQRF